MSMTFTKLFSSITASTVWCEPSDTRVVWITMLAMADKHGRVWASIPGLAKEAAVTVDACRAAINRFLSPDPDSRTLVAEGRRIEPIDGGWRLINHAKYRGVRDEEERLAYKAQWQREHRSRFKCPEDKNGDKCGQPLNAVDSGSHNAEAEAEAEAKKKELLPEAVIQLPALGSKFYAVTKEQAEHWAELFPAIDVMQCLRSMVAWLESNPKNGKTTSGMARFVTGWLSKEQNKAPRNEALPVRPKKTWTQGDPNNPADWAAAEIPDEDGL
jgi:hypothetical protein